MMIRSPKKTRSRNKSSTNTPGAPCKTTQNGEASQASAILKKIDNRVSSINNNEAYLLLIKHPLEVAQIFESFLRPGQQAPVQLSPLDQKFAEKRIMGLISQKMWSN